MGSFKKNHPTPKIGDMIAITARHISDKVQPRFKIGTIWQVKGVNTTPTRGYALIQVQHPDKENELLHINAHNFDWRIVSESELSERKLQKEIKDDTDKMMREFSLKEQTQIAFIPLIIENLVWIYADKCVSFCAGRRISETVKLTRAVRMVKKKWQEKMDMDLNGKHQYQIKSETERFIDFCGNDFTILYFTVNRELIKHNPDMPYEELSTNALIGMTLIKFLDYINFKVFKVIKERLGRDNVIGRDPLIDSLYTSLDAYAGNYKDFDFNEKDIHACMRILEIKLNQIDFHVEKNN